MQASELRIGNLLFDDESDDVMIVSRIESKEYTEWNSGDEYNIVCKRNESKRSYYEGDFRPIPLTEEWLLNFGFYKEKNITNSYSKEKLTIDVGCDKIHPYGRVYFNSWAIIEKKLDYVHQLQNLYFALTNTELILKQ